MGAEVAGHGVGTNQSPSPPVLSPREPAGRRESTILSGGRQPLLGLISLVLILAALSTGIISRAQQAVDAPPANKALQTELLEMKTEDQRYRNELHVQLKKLHSTIGSTDSHVRKTR
jgi:hypothetical protein